MAVKYEENLEVSSAGAMQMEYPIAGLGSRTYAFTIDWHIRVVLVLAWYFLIYLGGLGLSQVFDESYQLSRLSGKAIGYFLILPAFFIYVMYHPVLEFMMKGRTPGKRIAGIRIITLDGAVPSFGGILVRNVFRLLDSFPAFYLVGIGACLLTGKQVRIGDIAARTVLVHEETMQDKAIEMMTNATNESGLNATQVQVLHDLLGRWKQLDKNSRIDLGKRLLNTAGKPVAEESSFSALDARVHDALLELSKGNA